MYIQQWLSCYLLCSVKYNLEPNGEKYKKKIKLQACLVLKPMKNNMYWKLNDVCVSD